MVLYDGGKHAEEVSLKTPVIPKEFIPPPFFTSRPQRQVH